MFEKRCFHLRIIALGVIACWNSVGQTCFHLNRLVVPTVLEGAADMSSSKVSLKIVRRRHQTPFFELRNGSDTTIFVSYAPPNVGNPYAFQPYALQRKLARNGEFEPYGEPWDFAPRLRPVSSGAAIIFPLASYPREKGEYRVRVAYYDDEKLYKMLKERLMEMTAAEETKVNEGRKYVMSNTFLVPPSPGRKRSVHLQNESDRGDLVTARRNSTWQLWWMW